MKPGEERQFLCALLDAAIDAALPAKVVPPCLPAPPKGERTSSRASAPSLHSLGRVGWRPAARPRDNLSTGGDSILRR